MTEALNPRRAAILDAVVRNYISTGQPVGSGTVAAALDESLSSATIRNVMAQLERQGYLEQPHTSAGRTPTARGYGAYVGNLMRHGGLQDVDETSIRQQLHTAPPALEALLQQACSMLSEMTQQVGMVLAPPPADTNIRQINLVRVDGGRLLVLFVTDSGLIHSHTISEEEELLESDLEAAAGYLGARFRGRTLRQIRDSIGSDRRRTVERSEALAFRLVRRSLADVIEEAEVWLEGTFHLLDNPELADRDALTSIFEEFEERRQIGRLLTECGSGSQPRVLIGRERLPAALGECALVAASYRSGSQPLGALGILGPARMEYHRTIPMVDAMARATSEMVTELYT